MSPTEQGYRDGIEKAHELCQEHGLYGLARHNWRHLAANDGGAQQHGFFQIAEIEQYYAAYTIGAQRAVEDMA